MYTLPRFGVNGDWCGYITSVKSLFFKWSWIECIDVLCLWYAAMVGKHLRNVDCRGHSCNERCWDGILKVAILALRGFQCYLRFTIFWPRKRNLRRYQWVSWKVWRTLTQDPGSYPKIATRAMNREAGCLGDLLGMKYYPVIYRL